MRANPKTTYSTHTHPSKPYETLLTRSNALAKVLPHYLLSPKNSISPRFLSLTAFAAFTVLRKPVKQTHRSSFVRFAQVRRQSNSVWNFLPAASLRVRLRHAQTLRQGKTTSTRRKFVGPANLTTTVTHPARIWNHDFLDKLTFFKPLGNSTDLSVSPVSMFPVVNPHPIEHDHYDLKSEFTRLKRAGREEPTKLPKGFFRTLCETYDRSGSASTKLTFFKVYLDVISSRRIDPWAHNLLTVTGAPRDYLPLLPYPIDSRQRLSTEYFSEPLAALWKAFKTVRLNGKIEHGFRLPLSTRLQSQKRYKSAGPLAGVSASKRLLRPFKSLTRFLRRRKSAYRMRLVYAAANVDISTAPGCIAYDLNRRRYRFRKSPGLSTLKRSSKSIKLSTRANINIYKNRYSALDVKQFKLSVPRSYPTLHSTPSKPNPMGTFTAAKRTVRVVDGACGVRGFVPTSRPKKTPLVQSKHKGLLRSTNGAHTRRLSLSRRGKYGIRWAYKAQRTWLSLFWRASRPQMPYLIVRAQLVLSSSKSFLRRQYGPKIKFRSKFTNTSSELFKNKVQKLAKARFSSKKKHQVKSVSSDPKSWKYSGPQLKRRRGTSTSRVTSGFRALSQLTEQFNPRKRSLKPRIWPSVVARASRSQLKDYYDRRRVWAACKTLALSQYRNHLPTSNFLRNANLLRHNLRGPVRDLGSVKLKFRLTRRPKVMKLINRQVKRASSLSKFSRRKVSRTNNKLAHARYLWLTRRSPSVRISQNYTHLPSVRDLRSPISPRSALSFFRLQGDLIRKQWVRVLKLNKPALCTTALLPIAATDALVYVNSQGLRNSQAAVLLEEPTYPVLRPLYSVRFLSSAFAFLDFISLECPGSDDVAYSFFSEESVMDCVVFPDADLVKAWMFRRLQNQKSLFQSRVQLNEDDSDSEDTAVLVPEYEIHHPYAFTSTQNLTASTTRLPKVLNVSKTWSWLYTTIDDQGDPETYAPLRVKRIRFKPGYERIWRIGRTSIRELVDAPLRYQYRLTPRLQKLYFAARKDVSPHHNFTLEFALLAVKFTQDRWSLGQLLSSRSVFLNGFSCVNSSVKLFTNDFIQLVVNLKFYIALKWLKSWSEIKRSRVNKIFYRKFKPSSPNNVNTARTPKKNLNLPVWFFELIYVHCDIPKFFELDYFTLSIFVIHEETSLERWVPSKVSAVDWCALNMYNWKYIT